ncbi:hypothetical protein HMPREF1487_07236 [Pseudomonas sp. HPB0071]|nr:hypothetical protein HMPREF1487_07236 [Pseudomonas sp. HPB0071]SHI50961.1 hypothetical protein SAMN05216295_10270 [Pseudomonas zeshuii]
MSSKASPIPSITGGYSVKGIPPPNGILSFCNTVCICRTTGAINDLYTSG